MFTCCVNVLIVYCARRETPLCSENQHYFCEYGNVRKFAQPGYSVRREFPSSFSPKASPHYYGFFFFFHYGFFKIFFLKS